jgi:hypothetical protein
MVGRMNGPLAGFLSCEWGINLADPNRFLRFPQSQQFPKSMTGGRVHRTLGKGTKLIDELRLAIPRHIQDTPRDEALDVRQESR